MVVRGVHALEARDAQRLCPIVHLHPYLLATVVLPQVHLVHPFLFPITPVDFLFPVVLPFPVSLFLPAKR